MNEKDVQQLGMSVRVGEAGAGGLLKTSSARDELMMMRGVLLGTLVNPEFDSSKFPSHMFNARAALAAAQVFTAMEVEGNPAEFGKASQINPALLGVFRDMINKLSESLEKDLMNESTDSDLVGVVRELVEHLIEENN